MTDQPDPAAVTGTWDVRIATPVGTIEARYVFAERDGVLTGTAESQGDTGTLEQLTTEPADDGVRVTWAQRVTRPLRLNLTFDVVVAGDTLTGRSRAGRLPASTVTGARRRAEDAPQTPR
ncbi:hypothetical protein ACFQBY_12945 [Promicromonospora citrea]|uniref:Uncharacterized protein n=1 Tax=Promicromonospora citrea TaxID=43677 RepID=A0A8H9L403_9MICO|nr:hypothetical protein [Promicromonospora citrea]NNH54613.1 hypothetical protein [Promicromonospora citrea]GGM30646.1 hypothetical protein GCM10010102_27560 [Promicromonospora citrea]